MCKICVVFAKPQYVTNYRTLIKVIDLSILGKLSTRLLKLYFEYIFKNYKIFFKHSMRPLSIRDPPPLAGRYGGPFCRL